MSRKTKNAGVPKYVDPIDLHVGQRIRAYRLRRAMSQAALGEQVGVTFQQIQKYERGANRIGSSRLKKIATILQVPVAALFGADEDEAGEADALLTEILSQPHAARLLLAFDAIKDAKLRLNLVEIAERMSQAHVK